MPRQREGAVMRQAISLGRRGALGGLAGAGLLAAARRSRAAGGTLVVANWGGDWNDRTVKFVEAPLVESKGYRIDRILTLEPERKTKLVAETRFHRGTIDVAHLNDADAFEMDHQDVLWTTLWVSTVSTAICVVAGFPVAYYLRGPRGRE